MSTKPGDIITMSSFTHAQPALKAGYKVPHGRLAVFLLLGDVDKKAPEAFDAGAALRHLGWFPESDFGPAEPGTGSIKGRAADLAASMKYMAWLHRANKDVAAADEFAKGAELVGTMAAEIERMQADVERYQFGRESIINTAFAEKLGPFAEEMDAIAGPEPEQCTSQEYDEIVDKLIAVAKREGVFPVKPERVLTEEAQADRDQFEIYSDERGCSCHINPPCGHCTHPGNPLNQDDDSCWMVKP